MKIYDVTLPISPALPVWPGDSPISLERDRRMEDGARNNLSHLACSVHAGTHVDAPLHFIAGGADVVSLSLDVLVGPARVVAWPDVDVITAARLAQLDLSGVSRLLFKTRNSNLARDRFVEDFAALTADAAQWIVERGVRLVGVDYFSVERLGGDGSVHRTLLGAGVVIVEGLDLRDAPPGDYELFCLPMKLVGSEGAPARVILATSSAPPDSISTRLARPARGTRRSGD
jgi:arylformamidase